MDDQTIAPAPAIAPASAPHPSLWLFFRVWFALGLQSFGGGAATLYLIRRTVVEQRGWLSDEEFSRDFSLCFLAPGINLLCLTILVGNRIAGLAGSVVALAGLLLPSVSITIAMTALYAEVQQLSALQDALRAIVPATVGLGVLLSAGMAQPLLAASRRQGRGTLAISAILLAGSAIATALLHPPVFAILLTAGVIGALTAWWSASRRAGHD